MSRPTSARRRIALVAGVWLDPAARLRREVCTLDGGPGAVLEHHYHRAAPRAGCAAAAVQDGTDQDRAGPERHPVLGQVRPEAGRRRLDRRASRPNLRRADGTVPARRRDPPAPRRLAEPVAPTPPRPLPERFFAAGEEKTTIALPAGLRLPLQGRPTTGDQLHDPQPHARRRTRCGSPTTSTSSRRPRRRRQASRPCSRSGWTCRTASVYPVFDVLKGTGTNGSSRTPTRPTDPYTAASAAQRVDGRPATACSSRPPATCTRAACTTTSTASGPRDGERRRTSSTSDAHYYEPAGAVSWDVAMTATAAGLARRACKTGDVAVASHATYDTTRRVVVRVDGDHGRLDGRRRPTAPTRSRHRSTSPASSPTATCPRTTTTAATPERAARPDARCRRGRADRHGHHRGLHRTAPATTGRTGRCPTVARRAADHVRQPATRRSANGIWHTITACKAPCNRVDRHRLPARRRRRRSSTPASSATPARRRRAASTWTTPADLAAGTYTYFCRIHPFMRGAFRVVTSG